jgi:hypothetical protein
MTKHDYLIDLLIGTYDNTNEMVFQQANGMTSCSRNAPALSVRPSVQVVRLFTGPMNDFDIHPDQTNLHPSNYPLSRTPHHQYANSPIYLALTSARR